MPWIVVVPCGGRSDHGGACLRRVMFITRRRTLCAGHLRHCLACPDRVMFPVSVPLSCQHEPARAALSKRLCSRQTVVRSIDAKDLAVEAETLTKTQTALKNSRTAHAWQILTNRGTPYDDDTWIATTSELLGLESTLRPRGRPRTKMQNDGK